MKPRLFIAFILVMGLALIVTVCSLPAVAQSQSTTTFDVGKAHIADNPKWEWDSVNGWQQLVPDVRVRSAPYALNVELARTNPNLNCTALLQTDYAVGNGPIAVAFDGAKIWVANYYSNTVSVLRASDGFPVMTPTVGSNPKAIAFDGANMWVVNMLSNTVSVLRTSDGLPVMTPTVGANPRSIAFDGVNMWVANFNSGSVSVLRASDGFHVMTPTVGGGPLDIAFDGANMWVVNYYNNTVSVLRASDGFHVMTPTVGIEPYGLAFDGANMWIADISREHFWGAPRPDTF